MNNSIIAEGKTTAEAIENGLKELKVSKDKVNVKVLENTEKRSFFSILAPSIENIKELEKEILTLKENRQAPIMEIQPEQIEQAKQNIITFLNDFSKKFEDLNYNIEIKENNIVLELMGKDANRLIGYRGETLNALQTIITIISNKELTGKVRVILDIAGYREKRKKVLEDLADKVSKTVLKTGRTITLEPMPAYERKIIHSRLQNNDKVKTFSKGEEPYRKIVISKNK